MDALLGLAMMVFQARAAIIMFRGEIKEARRVQIIIGVDLLLMLLAIFGMTMH